MKQNKEPKNHSCRKSTSTNQINLHLEGALASLKNKKLHLPPPGSL